MRMGAVTSQQEVTTWPTQASWSGQGLVGLLQPETSSPSYWPSTGTP